MPDTYCSCVVRGATLDGVRRALQDLSSARRCDQPRGLGEMSLLHAIVCLGAGFLTCWGLIPLIRRRAAKRSGLGRSTEFHHTHKTPVPRLGGVALVAGFVVV